mmetsp:Transcript_37900/g.102622  ORF Transcript_37900/g.102622 Transcript_37900/m.102622 type:complete len:332 (-) Transcript_37900:71-1066(-)
MAEDDKAALEFFIFGHPVTMSPSPEIHNTGFAQNGSPHKYLRFDSPGADAVLERLRQADCGGGSVTIPHKETLLKSMDELSDAARTIGAVNTITKVANGKLHGDNTDWLGIRNQLRERLAGRAGAEAPVCLLCGAGGTARAAAYALREMGAGRCLIYNRTASRAEALAKEFGFEACNELAGLAAMEQLHIIVNTLPGASDFVLPDASVLQRCRPVVLEAAYIPRRTAFLRQALDAGCEVVEGVEMLYEQGCAQCEIWTGKPAPRAAIACALLTALFTSGSSHPAFAKMEPHDVHPASLAKAAQGTAKRSADAAAGGVVEAEERAPVRPRAA